eukprot:m.426184 g.426184  ORF g.426184 m.426184 type:complete len:63 (+) comp56694_c0_seq1:390-578(+)
MLPRAVILAFDRLCQGVDTHTRSQELNPDARWKWLVKENDIARVFLWGVRAPLPDAEVGEVR